MADTNDTTNNNTRGQRASNSKDQHAEAAKIAVQYEHALLGFILTDPDKMLEVGEILPNSDYFTDPMNRCAYALFLKLYNENKFPGSPALMVSELVSNKDATAFNDIDESGRYVNKLIDAPSTYATKFNPRAFREYAEAIKWQKESRDLAQFGRELSANSLNISVNDKESYVDEIENRLASITLSTHGNEGLKHISFMTGSLEEQLATLHSGMKLAAGVPTGLDTLDKTLNGLKGGEVCVLAARPGQGKTTLSMQIAYNVAKMPPENGKKKAVLIFSLEMMEDQLTSRFVANIGRINMQAFMSEYQHYVDDHYYKRTYGEAFENKMKAKLDEQYDRTQIALEEMHGLPIYPTTESSLTPNAIKSMVMQKKHELEMKGETVGLVIIDYLQLMQPATSKSNASRTEEVGDMSRKMKILAKDYDVPVLLLAQLNRNADVDTRPTLKDLRESGSIEQDADKVIFIWSENATKSASDFTEYQDEQARYEALRKEQMKIIISVAKNRQGECGDCPVIFDKGFQTFISQSSEYSSTGESFAEFAEKYYQKTRTEDIFWPLRAGEIPSEYESHRFPSLPENPYLDPMGKVVTLANAQSNQSGRMRVRNAQPQSRNTYGFTGGTPQYDNTKPSDMPPLVDETDITSGYEDLDDVDSTGRDTDSASGKSNNNCSSGTPWDDLIGNESDEMDYDDDYDDDEDELLDMDDLDTLDNINDNL